MNDTALVTMDEWLDATRHATQETVSTMLQLDVKPLMSELTEGEEPLSGAYISLTCCSGAVEICLLTNKQGYSKLARAMLQMDESDALDDLDARDAVGEMLNIIAGVVKRQLNHKTQHSIKLGFPRWVYGELKPCNMKDKREADALLGETPSKLLVVKVA